MSDLKYLTLNWLLRIFTSTDCVGYGPSHPGSGEDVTSEETHGCV